MVLSHGPTLPGMGGDPGNIPGVGPLLDRRTPPSKGASVVTQGQDG